MMLHALLENIIDTSAIQDCVINNITVDSREIEDGTLFVALKGTQEHGLNYAKAVEVQGAVAILWESDDSINLPSVDLPLIRIANLRDYLGLIAKRFCSNLDKKMTIVGITGTDGKTSVSHFLSQALNNCAVMGTLGIGLLDNLQTATHTTPDVINVHKNISRLKSDSVDALAMEVSSHALDQGRVADVDFDVAVLTNLTRDHLDYHGTVEAYAEAKAKLFSWPNLTGVVVNGDDEFGRAIGKEQAMKSGKKVGGASKGFSSAADSEAPLVIHYGIGNVSDYPKGSLVAEDTRLNSEGLEAVVTFEGQKALLKVSVLGHFNISNLLAATGAMLITGESLENAVSKLNTVHTVSGRMEKISSSEVLTVIDYAHTPNALETVLTALREHTDNKLICVFGCGGDRDSGKRPEMAKIAESCADLVIVTDDNPRTENPELIMHDIVAGFVNSANVTIEHDRTKAIRLALTTAQKGDTVLIAGKGHENGQILASGTIPFNDREQAEKVLQELAA